MKIERKKVSMQVFDRIKEMIKEEKMQPGDKLPTESKLTEMFGVSRTPVREALSVLEASGLIASKQGGGSVVQATSISSLMEETHFEFVDPEEILNLLETRLILETGAAYLAGERRTVDDLDEMKQALDEIRYSQDKSKIGHKEDIAFHKVIAKASHNPILIGTMENISELHEKAIKFSLMKNMGITGKRQRVLNEHEHIYKAVELGDPKKAEQAMFEHLTNAKKKFEKELDQLAN
ncbi:FadR/GntR family transcriptional regulator [Alteribacillus sp. JSM 102045]|uniref:FadR/GntR family transcriptional regulator n=1 Tax=Alteribacillus sp. JSM 102045 TaxID=1562101 RepID=UPI0035BF44B3